MTKSQEDLYTHSDDGKPFSLVRLVTGHRAFVLLFALILQILLSGPDMGGRLFDVIVKVVTILAAIFMTSDSKRHLYFGLALGIPSLILIIFSDTIDHGTLDWFTFAVVLCLYLFIIRLMLIKIFNAKFITINTIGLALCTYVLIGAVWVLFYTPIVATDPNAFSVPITGDGDAFHTMTYFSYVTLTTLGYGDISPVSNLARNLAVIEALTGTLFLAVLISRLVGSYASRKNQ
jgi:hypothetical protein